MGKNTFYITTPIYYPSDKLHIGHAYTTVAADAIARYHRLCGKDVFFLTGSDEHGQKIERIAKERGKTPKEYVDEIVKGFQHLWQKLDIAYDDFIRTTEERHCRVVQELFRKIYEKGDIYKGEYKGWYCTPCETFFPESRLVDGNCPDCGRPVELLQEESYFFRMSKYADRLLEYIEANPDFIQPTSRRNEMIQFIKSGLEDLCVSRTSFSWGIPVPIDEGHVIYVWFDALTNYLTGIGYLDDPAMFQKYWPADVHLVGKEIVRFHSVIWPIILMAAGLELPKKVYGHGWLLFDSDKMSKSKGNVVDPLVLIDRFGVDAIRYFLLREISFGSDGNFSWEALVGRINADLANDLGNLVHRSSAMMKKYYKGIVPEPGPERPIDAALREEAANTKAKLVSLMEELDLSTALATIWRFIGAVNKYIDEAAPWALAKDESKGDELARVMYNLAESIRWIALFVYPFIPSTAKEIWNRLGLDDELTAHLLGEVRWGEMPSGTAIRPGSPLFPRIEDEDKEPPAKAPAKSTVEIDIEEFARLDIRLARVIAAERVAGADKLLKLKVDLGSEERQIVAGLAQHYKPEELVGKNVALLANLKPTKIRGELSQGMVLAAVADDGRVRALTVDEELPAGSKIR
ncbi:MAG: methionine--tRNA ligase [Limnochordia bacterium]|nr:methionine--tRNA ligase [Bacillota bacterium]